MYVVEFTPPTAAGKHTKCFGEKVASRAVETLLEREVTCGHLMKYVRAHPSTIISGGRTKTLWNHFKTTRSIFIFCHTMGLRFQNLVSPVYLAHFSSTYLCWVWGWVARFGGIVHFVWCSPSSLENTEYDNNLQIVTVYGLLLVRSWLWRTCGPVLDLTYNPTLLMTQQSQRRPPTVLHSSRIPSHPHLGFCGFPCGPH